LFLSFPETKNQWARDDPAFIVIQAAFVAVGHTSFEEIFACMSNDLIINTIFLDNNLDLLVGIRGGVSASWLLGLRVECSLYFGGGLAPSGVRCCLYVQVKKLVNLDFFLYGYNLHARLVYVVCLCKIA